MTGPVLVDTSVWVELLRSGCEQLEVLLNRGRVMAHPMVIGELACGHLRRRNEILTWLSELPQATQASHDEVLELINNHKLMGRGIGYVDAHLLAATMLTAPARLWTMDRRLQMVAKEMGVATTPVPG